MIRVLFILLISGLLSPLQARYAIMAQNDNEHAKKAGIEFQKTEHNFEEITYDGDGTIEFEFTNTGEIPLIIHNVNSACGCTIPEWNKSPVKPGKKGIIRLKYDTKSPGSFNKTVKVYSNATAVPVILTIKGTVVEP